MDALKTRGEWQDAGPWSLVHFCGHSGVHPDETRDEAYVYVPSQDPLYDAEGIDIRRFARLLPQVRFLYLSSCRSADRGFVYELARQQVPAILGFRWALNDDTAVAFADAFYDNLFTGDEAQDLVSAFKVSQERTHETRQQDNTWASAMLMVANMSKALCQSHRLSTKAQL
jgi:CHAT domain-containing protein